MLGTSILTSVGKDGQTAGGVAGVVAGIRSVDFRLDLKFTGATGSDPTVGAVNVFLATAGLFKLEEHDLRIGSQAQRRSPGAGSAGSEDLHFSDAAQPVDELPVDAASHPTPGDELANVRMSG